MSERRSVLCEVHDEPAKIATKYKGKGRRFCRDGGIGRHAGFRCLWGKTRGGSSPLLGIIIKINEREIMTIVRILQYPDPRLKLKAEKVTDFGAETQKMIDDMFETHYASQNCAALACSQLDFKNPKHITVIDFSEHKNQPLCLVNGEIIERSGTETSPEGCMSVYGAYEKVTRSEKITVKAQDRHGKEIVFEAEGFMAKCIQHELDHLDGKLFIDHLSNLKRDRIRKRIEKVSKFQHKHDENCRH